ncbi:MAG: hypothetical protein ACO3A4_12920 [Silvanigrellaceae bacterium]
MGVVSIDSLIKMAQDEPQRVRKVIDELIEHELSSNSSLKMFFETSMRFEEQWRKVSELRLVVDESIIAARKNYRELLKKTEASAMRGSPRLYWFAKQLFSRIRKNSIEYQIAEAEHKLESLRTAQQVLMTLLEKTRTGMNNEVGELLLSRELAEQKSRKHSSEIELIRNEYNTSGTTNLELKNILQRMEIKQSVVEAVVRDLGCIDGPEGQHCQPKTIDSPRMLTSKLPYVGFSNRPKLKTLIEKSEYAAEHAERDLEKVREGLKFANEAAVNGRATSVSIDWLAYCKEIVTRYEEVAAQHVTPH